MECAGGRVGPWLGDKRPYLFSGLLSETLGEPAALSHSPQIWCGGWVRFLEGSRGDLHAWAMQEQEGGNHSNWRIREEPTFRGHIVDGRREGL